MGIAWWCGRQCVDRWSVGVWAFITYVSLAACCASGGYGSSGLGKLGHGGALLVWLAGRSMIFFRFHVWFGWGMAKIACFDRIGGWMAGAFPL